MQLFTRNKWALAGVMLAMILVFVTGTGGAIYAADAAVPGEPLYGLDQALEATQLRFTSRPEAVVGLLLAIAQERLDEAQILLEQGNLENLGQALEGYGSTVSSLAVTLGDAEGDEVQELAHLVDTSFSGNANQPADSSLVAGAEPDQEGAGPEDMDYCTGAEPHPVASALEETYGVTYEQIMAWFCEENLGFGEIMLLLETSARTGETPEILLESLETNGGWGKVWQAEGLIGKTKASVGPSAAFPVGPAELANGLESAPAGPERTEAGMDYAETWCVGVDPHPVAERLADSYENVVDYDQIMGWFCDGFGLGEIKLALETSEGTGVSPGELLTESREMGGWGLVWQKYGLVGRGEDDDTGKLPDDEEGYCVGVDPHPVAEKLSAEYGMAVDQIMEWFCEDKYGLGEIKLALETSRALLDEGDAADATPGDLLAKRQEKMGWGEIWQELGMIGKPDRDEANPGAIEEAGTGKDKPVPPGLQKPKKPKPVKPPKPAKPANPGNS